MRRTTLLGAILICVISGVGNRSAAGGTEVYSLDPVHSTVGFKVRHFFTNATGRFREFKGEIRFDRDRLEKSSVEAVIQTASLETGDRERDEHLRSPDFFDVAKYPTISFKSTDVKRIGGDQAAVAGKLTIMGVTKDVTLKVKFFGKGKGLKGETRAGWHGVAVINRFDFGLSWNKVIEGTKVVGDQVEIELEIEGIQQAGK